MVNNKSNGTATRNKGWFIFPFLSCLFVAVLYWFFHFFFLFRCILQGNDSLDAQRDLSVFLAHLALCCLISSGSKYGHLLNNSSILKEWCNKQTTTNIWIIEEWPINNRWGAECGALLPPNRIVSVATGNSLYLFICSFIYLHHSAKMHLRLSEDQKAANVKFRNGYRTDSILNLEFSTSLQYTCLPVFYLCFPPSETLF